MQALHALLREVAGDVLGEPRMSRDPVWVIDKATGKMRELRPSGRRPRRWRRRR